MELFSCLTERPFQVLLEDREVHVYALEKKSFALSISYIFFELGTSHTAQKMKFSVKNFFSKYEQIGSFLLIWSHLLKKSLMENFIFVQCQLKSI